MGGCGETPLTDSSIDLKYILGQSRGTSRLSVVYWYPPVGKDQANA
jgi:hypothetical protein